MPMKRAMWCVEGCLRWSLSSMTAKPAPRSTALLYGDVACPTGISRSLRIDVKMCEFCSPVNMPYCEKGTCGAVRLSLANRDIVSMKCASNSRDRFTNDQQWKKVGKYSCGNRFGLSSGAAFVGSSKFSSPTTTNAPSLKEVLKNGSSSSNMAGISLGSKYS